MSVVQLSLENHNDVIELFSDDLSHYYFLINDLLDNHYQSDSFQVFGEYDEAGHLVSILLNNYNNLTYYSRDKRDAAAYSDALRKCTFSKISGPSVLVEELLPFVKVKSDSLSYLGVVKEVKLKRRYPDLPLYTVGSEEEFGMQFDLFKSTAEYNLNMDRDKYITNELNRLRQSNDRTVYMVKDHVMITSCSTIRESTNSAIIIGVVTHPDHRRKSYGTEALIGLCNQLLEEGKYPYFFYNNPEARVVYKNLGMTEVCEWRVVLLEA